MVTVVAVMPRFFYKKRGGALLKVLRVRVKEDKRTLST